MLTPEVEEALWVEYKECGGEGGGGVLGWLNILPGIQVKCKKLPDGGS
jgi:hypothetical protein